MSWELQWVFVPDRRTSPSLRLADSYAYDVLFDIRTIHATDAMVLETLRRCEGHRIMTYATAQFSRYIQRCTRYRTMMRRLINILNQDDYTAPNWKKIRALTSRLSHANEHFIFDWRSDRRGDYQIDQSSPPDRHVTLNCRRMVRSTRVTILDQKMLKPIEINSQVMTEIYELLMNALSRNAGLYTTEGYHGLRKFMTFELSTDEFVSMNRCMEKDRSSYENMMHVYCPFCHISVCW